MAQGRDVVGVRAAHRGERIFLCRMRSGPEETRALLEESLRVVDRLATEPRWYNALTTNGTNSIRARAAAGADDFAARHRVGLPGERLRQDGVGAGPCPPCAAEG